MAHNRIRYKPIWIYKLVIGQTRVSIIKFQLNARLNGNPGYDKVASVTLPHRIEIA